MAKLSGILNIDFMLPTNQILKSDYVKICCSQNDYRRFVERNFKLGGKGLYDLMKTGEVKCPHMGGIVLRLMYEPWDAFDEDGSKRIPIEQEIRDRQEVQKIAFAKLKKDAEAQAQKMKDELEREKLNPTAQSESPAEARV